MRSTRTSSSTPAGLLPRASSTTSPTSAVSSSISREDVRAQRRAVVLREPVELLDRLDVRPQAGDRGSQLVAGVGDEMALRLDRALERVQRRIEAPGEPGELVVAA